MYSNIYIYSIFCVAPVGATQQHFELAKLNVLHSNNFPIRTRKVHIRKLIINPVSYL